MDKRRRREDPQAQNPKKESKTRDVRCEKNATNFVDSTREN